MTRSEALEIAKRNRTARMNEFLKELHRDPSSKNLNAFDLRSVKAYGYRHGWYRVGEFMFNSEDVTGQKYDITQGGWAFV